MSVSTAVSTEVSSIHIIRFIISFKPYLAAKVVPTYSKVKIALTSPGDPPVYGIVQVSGNP